jgi:hypothetical protein
MCQALPAAMLARLSALGAELIAWAAAHHDAPLAEQEQAVLAAVRAALPDLLGVVIQLSQTALDPGVTGVGRCCPRCGRRVRVQEWRPRQVQTVCGTLSLRRPWYRCRPCRQGFSPLDTALRLPARARLSPALTAWVVRLGATTTFREGAALLDDLTGLLVAPDTIRAQSEQCGTALAVTQEAAIAQVRATQEAAEPVEAAPGTLVVEADGVLVRYLDGWHEVKVGVVGGTQPLPEQPLTALSYVAARESADQFGPRLLTEAARRGALDVVGWSGPRGGRGLAVGDGAPWIWNLAADHFGARTEVVDFYHAAEHLWEVARALHGTGTPEAAAWAAARIHDLYHAGVAPVRAALARARAPTVAAGEALRRERGYFAANAGRMDYPAIRAQGLPIGSGAVESSAKHVVQQRMKRPGQRWSAHGGAAMIALRACLASGRFPHAVATHPY